MKYKVGDQGYTLANTPKETVEELTVEEVIKIVNNYVQDKEEGYPEFTGYEELETIKQMASHITKAFNNKKL